MTTRQTQQKVSHCQQPIAAGRSEAVMPSKQERMFFGSLHRTTIRQDAVIPPQIY
jgi:hypothetical protein